MKNIWFPIEQYHRPYAKRRIQSFVFTVIGCLAVVSVITFGAVYVVAQPASTSSELPAVKAPNFGRHFQEFGREGSIAVLNHS
ncbi:hypothetical protein [Nostoc sp.]|uniref:hypothetical protein n=1 Tax=Nostoc sp. TaxID=1180 RepID=UPI003FA5D635